jgi:hypothetical protein
MKIQKILLALIFAAISLVGCVGGGGGAGGGAPTPGATAPTVTGTVATGLALDAATVTIKDTAGKKATGTSSSTGAFSIDVTGMTPPLMLVAEKTGYHNMYSIIPTMDVTASSTKRINITQVTSLVLYELTKNDPGIAYRDGGFSSIDSSALAAAETKVRAWLPTNSVSSTFSMMDGQFTASSTADPYDVLLDAIGRISTMTSTNVAFAKAPTYILSSGTTTGSTSGPTLTLALVPSSITTTTPATVTATVLTATGSPVANAIVTFTTTGTNDAFQSGSNTALTDTTGKASVTLTTSSTSSGAATVAASSTVSGASVAGSLNYARGSSTFSLGAISLPSTTLSAYGTAAVSVSVYDQNNALVLTPMEITFSSVCASQGKAALTSKVTTSNGAAIASYLDNGCDNTSPGDTITATLSNGSTKTASLPVSAPSVGSLQFVSVTTTPSTTPPMITLKGTGGTDRSETARVTFKVVDSAGKPKGGQLVSFTLNTDLGGLKLSANSATSDSATGNVVVDVQSGTFSTSVRVTATTSGLSTQSDQLLVTTGVPSQDSISLSASTHNIEGWAIDGTETTLTMRLADHFKNPVPDGTAVAFRAEGGAVGASCTTVGGVCSVSLKSQETRPSNGRVTVLATAIGEEAFTDLNSNGTCDSSAEMIDANGASTDIADAFVDYNENGALDSNEPPINFNPNDGVYTRDNQFNGLLCTAGAAICSTTQKSMHVRASQVIVFSSSTAKITINNGNAIAMNPCAGGIVGAPVSVKVTVVDVNGNAMPAGTKVDFKTDNGLLSSTGYVVPDTIGCRTGFNSPDTCPVSVSSATFGDVLVSAQTDVTVEAGVCKDNAKSSGTFTVTVTTPKSTATTATATITD